MSSPSYPRTITRGPLKGQTVQNRRQQANLLARALGYSSHEARFQSSRLVFTADAYSRLSPKEREERERALEALARMRHDGLSRRQAAREAGTTPAKMERYVASALERRAGRYVPKSSDRLYRLMVFYTDKGQITLEVKDSRTASKIARYHTAVEHYRKTGDTSRLREFRGQYVQTGKRRYPFIIDPKKLDQFEAAGELSFVSLYQLAA